MRTCEATILNQSTHVFTLLNSKIEPAVKKQLKLNLTSIGGLSVPVEVINGSQAGTTLCLTGAIHGDEINGIEIIRQVTTSISPENLRGTIISVPVVNLGGYINRVRFLDEYVDLNRCFPGDQQGSLPERVAYTLFENITSHCDAIIDIHTGPDGWKNFPQLRVDLSHSQNANLLEDFNELPIIQNRAPKGSLREAATTIGKTAVVMEIGGSNRIEPDMVQAGARALISLLSLLGMTGLSSKLTEQRNCYYGGGTIRSKVAGVFISGVELGDEVLKGAVVGEIMNPMTMKNYKVKAPLKCTILGSSHNQSVDAGVVLLRVGLK